MNKYTIYCTEEQTKKARELGAPIQFASISDLRLKRYVYVDEETWEGDIQFVKESAEGWKELEDGRHICPACHTHEDDDSLTLKTGEVIPVEDWMSL